MDIAGTEDVATIERRRQGLVDPSLGELFIGFLYVALTAFGGVIPITRRMLVEQRRWVSADEFTELLSICQFLPGPNIGNMSIAIGARFHGALGSFMAAMGLLAAPCVIVIVLTGLYEHFSSIMVIRHIFAGVASVACGLVFALAVKIAWPTLKRRPVHALVFFVLPFIIIGVLRWPLVLVLVVMLPASVLTYGLKAKP